MLPTWIINGPNCLPHCTSKTNTPFENTSLRTHKSNLHFPSFPLLARVRKLENAIEAKKSAQTSLVSSLVAMALGT